MKKRLCRNKNFKPGPIIPLEEINRIFWNIRDIADNYLVSYEFKDPYNFISFIEDEIDKFYIIYESEISKLKNEF